MSSDPILMPPTSDADSCAHDPVTHDPPHDDARPTPYTERVRRFLSTVRGMAARVRVVVDRAARLVRSTPKGAMSNRFADPPDLKFLFEERRAVQASAILMSKAGGRENYTKLLKLLYLADRKSLIETGRPITGSTFVSMALGPVLSEVYECIRSDPEGGLWDRHIRTDGYFVDLIEDPGDDQLSDYDVQVLTDLATEYSGADYSDMINVVHGLPEWHHPKPAKVASLPAADVLRAVGEDEEAIADHATQNAYLGAVRRLLHSP